jgi:hypothetical protein
MHGMLTCACVAAWFASTGQQLKRVSGYRSSPCSLCGSNKTRSDDDIWSIVPHLRHLPPIGRLSETEIYGH